MAFTQEDIEAFIAALQADPQLRDSVRNAIIADDFLALPGIVRQLGERINALAERMDQLTERIDRLVERMDALTERMDRLVERMDVLTADVEKLVAKTNSLDGRVGNLEGWRYQSHYADNVASFLAPEYRKATLIVAGNYNPLLDMLDNGAITRAEFDDAMRLDILARARKGREANSPEVLLAIELSVVIADEDVERAHRRAEILRRSGADVEAAVDGESS